MFKKLLKYDMRSIFKYWWILAVTSLGMSVVGGIAIHILEADYRYPAIIMIFAGLAAMVSIFAIFALLLVSAIWMYVRFYQNLFTDEGYLTFTLPVKREQILLSKILTGAVLSFSTMIVAVIDILILMSIARGSLYGVLKDVFDEIYLFFSGGGFFAIVFVIEIIIIAIILSLLSSLAVFICITLGATVAKKHKLFAAIGVYYLYNMVMSFVGQFVMTLGVINVIGILTSLAEAATTAAVLLILLIAILILAVLYILLYTLELWMLDRKLNLA
ncbi:MAG: hypothetical protein IKA62_08885 [Clostridia bacterium]|nr:hypothetical protein [Clostridia bacterium]MBR2370972.1 hypothetical protein [Clostridia bacterium]